MAITDLVVLLSSIYLILLGASRGLLQSLIGPFSIIVTSFLSILYYQDTRDMGISLAIGLAGPLILNFLLKFLLKAWGGASDAGAEKPGILSSVAGAALTLCWGWVFIFLFLVLLALLPPLGKTLTAVHKDVIQSRSYIVVRPMADLFFGGRSSHAPVRTARKTGTDTASLAQDPRFQKVLQDPEVQKEIQNHDFADLLRNPKFIDLTKQIMSDPATFKRVMAVYSSNQAQLQALSNESK